MGALGACCWAVFSSYAADLPLEPFTAQTIFNATGLLGFLVVGAFWPAGVDLSAPGLLLLAYLGCLVNGLGYVLWLYALRMGSPARIAPLVYLCPFLALGLVALWLDERVFPMTYAGLAVNVGGIVLATAGRSAISGASGKG